MQAPLMHLITIFLIVQCSDLEFGKDGKDMLTEFFKDGKDMLTEFLKTEER
jgi:hypothetical protein